MSNKRDPKSSARRLANGPQQKGDLVTVEFDANEEE